MRRKSLIIAYQGKVSGCNVKVLVARLVVTEPTNFGELEPGNFAIVTMPSRQPWHCRLESIHSVIGTVELKRAFPMGRTDAFTYPPYSQEHPLNVWFQRGGTSPRGHLRYFDVHTLGTRGLLTPPLFPMKVLQHQFWKSARYLAHVDTHPPLTSQLHNLLSFLPWPG